MSNRENQEKQPRILYWDFLKLIAAFLVVFYHFSYYNLDYGFIENIGYTPNINRILMSFAACSVPIFFMVNGTLLFSKHREIKNVYLKALKILILYIVWSFAYFPGWFFRTLIILYILFPVFQWLLENKKIAYYLICVSVFILPFLYNAVILIIKCFNPHLNLEIFGHTLIPTGAFTLYSVLYFLIGPIINKHNFSSFIGLFLIIAGWIYLVFECTVYTNINNSMYDGVNSSFPTIGALLLSSGVYIISKHINFLKLNKVICYASDFVLPIYLLHSLCIKLIALVIKIENNLFISVIMTTVICLICGFIGKLLKKVPIINWFFKV